MEHFILAATALGLGTCWIGVFDEEHIKEILSVPKEVRVVALTPVGYPKEKRSILDQTITAFAHIRPRKELPEIVFFEEWGRKI